MKSEVPQPIVFSLDAANGARLRTHLLKTNGVRGWSFSYALFASIGIFNGVTFARLYGWQSAFASGSIVFYAIYFACMTWRSFESCAVRPQTATMLTFDETGFSLVRNRSRTQSTHVACGRVRTVQLTAETIGIFGAWRAFTIIPRTALPDGGTQLMRFFADRIVSQGMSESTSRGVTTLVNSVTPLFTRS